MFNQSDTEGLMLFLIPDTASKVMFFFFSFLLKNLAAGIWESNVATLDQPINMNINKLLSSPSYMHVSHKQLFSLPCCPPGENLLSEGIFVLIKSTFRSTRKLDFHLFLISFVLCDIFDSHLLPFLY